MLPFRRTRQQAQSLKGGLPCIKEGLLSVKTLSVKTLLSSRWSDRHCVLVGGGSGLSPGTVEAPSLEIFKSATTKLTQSSKPLDTIFLKGAVVLSNDALDMIIRYVVQTMSRVIITMMLPLLTFVSHPFSDVNGCTTEMKAWNTQERDVWVRTLQAWTAH